MIQTTRLIYASRMSPSVADDLPRTIADIMCKSAPNNAATGVTGMLLSHAGYFLQALEGTKIAVSATFEKVSSDPRHSDVKIIGHVNCDARLFGKWDMCARSLSPADVKIVGMIATQGGFDPYRFTVDSALKLMTMIASLHDRQASAKALLSA